MQPASHKKKYIITASLLGATAIVVASAAFVNKQTTTDTTASTRTEQMSSANTTTTTEETANTIPGGETQTYENGTYSATGSYDTPGGEESITVSVTIVDDVITATNAQASGNDHDSEEYQSMFIANYKSLIIGKSIDSVSLSRVSGSSLTSNGFNDALDAIKQQADA